MWSFASYLIHVHKMSRALINVYIMLKNKILTSLVKYLSTH